MTVDEEDVFDPPACPNVGDGGSTCPPYEAPWHSVYAFNISCADVYSGDRGRRR